jgi:hypothetical protein
MTETRTEPVEKPVDPNQDATDKDWKSLYLQEIEQSRKYRHRAQQAEQEAQALRDQVPSDSRQEQLAQLEQQASQYHRVEEDNRRLADMLRDMAGRDALTRALVACGVGQGFSHGARMLDQAVSLLRDSVEVDLEGQSPQIRLAGQEESSQDIEQYVARWLAREAPHFLPPTGDTGSGAYPGQGTPQQASLAQLDASPARKAKFIAENGPGAYVQLARESR